MRVAVFEPTSAVRSTATWLVGLTFDRPYDAPILILLVGAVGYAVLMIASIAQVRRRSRDGAAAPPGVHVVGVGCYLVGALYLVPVFLSAYAYVIRGGDPLGVVFGQPLVLLAVCEAAAAHRLLSTGRSAAVQVAHVAGIALCVFVEIAVDMGSMPVRIVIGGFAAVLMLLAVLPLTPIVGQHWRGA